MKILLISDKVSPYLYDHFDRNRFKEIDLILSAGDLRPEYLSFLVTMINCPLFYVPGNHDDKYEDRTPEGCTDIDGKLIVFEGIRILGIGGSKRYRQGKYQYTDSEMSLRLATLYPKISKHKGFDILLTHSPALGLGDGKDPVHQGFKQFNRLLDKYEPKYMLHGHQHLNYGIGDRVIHYKNTTIINGYSHYIFDY